MMALLSAMHEKHSSKLKKGPFPDPLSGAGEEALNGRVREVAAGRSPWIVVFEEGVPQSCVACGLFHLSHLRHCFAQRHSPSDNRRTWFEMGAAL